METLKFALMYSLEIAVVALVGVTLIAGVYQLIREKARESRRGWPPRKHNRPNPIENANHPTQRRTTGTATAFFVWMDGPSL